MRTTGAAAKSAPRLGGAAAIYLVADVIAKGFQFGLTIGLTRLMNRHDYGLWGVLISFGGLLSLVLGFGLATAAHRWFYEHSDEDFGKLVFTLLVTQLVAVTAVVIGLDQLGTASFGVALDLAYLPAGRLVLIGGAAASLNSIPLTILIARRFATRASLLSLTATLLPNLGMLVAGIAYGELLPILWGYAIGQGVVAVLSFALGLTMSKVGFDAKALGQMIVFGLLLMPNGLAHWVLGFSDRYIIERFHGAAQTAPYHVAYTLAWSIAVLAQALNKSWTPAFMADMSVLDGTPSSSDDDAQNNVIERIRRKVRSVIGIAVLGGTVLALWGDELLELLLKDNYSDSMQLVGPVVLGSVFLALYYVPSTLLFHRRRVGLIPLLTGAAACLNIGLNLWLVPEYGAIAAAWTTVASYFALLIGMGLAAKMADADPIRLRDFRWMAAAVVLVLPGLFFDSLGAAWPMRWGVNGLLTGLIILALHLGGSLDDLRGLFERALHKLRAKRGFDSDQGSE